MKALYTGSFLKTVYRLFAMLSENVTIWQFESGSNIIMLGSSDSYS